MAHPVDSHVGARVRQRRTLLGMKQFKLGDAVNLSFQQIQKYEKGTNRVSAAMMVDMAAILDVGIGYFYDEIPRVRRDGQIETSALTEVALTLHGRRLIEAFLNLKNDQLRGAVADLAQVLARG